MIFELAAFDFETFLRANIKNVNRIELCKNYSIGGISPDYDLIHSVLLINKIDVFLMLRCRAGNFIYKKTEIEEYAFKFGIFQIVKYTRYCFRCINKTKRN